MYEHKSLPLLPRREFIHRALKHLGVSAGLVLFALGIGIIGYRIIEGYSWLDSLLNASMILSGMGLVDKPLTESGKIFASVYALFSGVLFLAGASIILAPFIHRILHSLHLQTPDTTP